MKSVIIVPTRELAQQIDMQFQGFSYYMPVSTAVIYGAATAAAGTSRSAVCKWVPMW